MLWFDVEKRYKTIAFNPLVIKITLWFDVEKRYKTIGHWGGGAPSGCGLM